MIPLRFKLWPGGQAESSRCGGNKVTLFKRRRIMMRVFIKKKKSNKKQQTGEVKAGRHV